MKTSIYVGLIEMGVFTYPDPQLEGWRFYRIEYGGFNEQCVYEGLIWLPPHIKPEELEDMFRKWQKKKNNLV